MGADKFLSGLPVIGGLFDNSDDLAMEELRKNQALFSGLNVPDLLQYQYDPEEYGFAGDYRPEDANASTITEDPKVRSAQLSALSKLAGLSDTGLSDVDALGYEKARQLGAQTARAGREAAIQEANSRGAGGSGLEFALREIANQEGARRGQDAALQQASDSARQRALYSQAYGDALSGFRGDDYRANSGNADILNQFNMANTQSRNQGQLTNLQNRQQIMNANTDQRNSGRQQKLDLAQQNFQNQLSKAQGIAGANSGIAQGYAAQGAANAGKRKSLGAGLGAGIGYLSGGTTGALAGGLIGGGVG